MDCFGTTMYNLTHETDPQATLHFIKHLSVISDQQQCHRTDDESFTCGVKDHGEGGGPAEVWLGSNSFHPSNHSNQFVKYLPFRIHN